MPRTSASITPMKAVRTFLKVGTCSETTCHLLNRAYAEPLVPEENAAMPFAGGILQHGYQCGLLWGAALAAGAEAYRRFGAGAKAEAAAVFAAQKLADAFHARYGELNCLELINTDWHKTGQVIRYFLKGGTLRCFGMAGGFSPLAHAVIEEALAGDDFPVPERSVSCSAELLRRMGASEQQVVMGAGLAGGIGLSGGACGAMGAAIWFTALTIRGEDAKLDYKDPRLLEMIETYLESSDYRFECGDIVGGTFASASDHSAHLCAGGCAKILDALSAQAPAS